MSKRQRTKRCTLAFTFFIIFTEHETNLANKDAGPSAFRECPSEEHTDAGGSYCSKQNAHDVGQTREIVEVVTHESEREMTKVNPKGQACRLAEPLARTEIALLNDDKYGEGHQEYVDACEVPQDFQIRIIARKVCVRNNITY